MDEKKRKTYVCKRARMATYLMERGFKPYEIAPDRDNPMYDVFLFTASDELYQAVTDYINKRRMSKMKIYLVIHEQDTDAACGCDVKTFLRWDEALAALQSGWEDTAKAWHYDEHEHHGEDECLCDNDHAVIREGYDSESWRIEVQTLDVRVAVSVVGGMVQNIIANTGVSADVYDLDVSDYPDEGEQEEADARRAAFEKLSHATGWRTVW